MRFLLHIADNFLLVSVFDMSEPVYCPTNATLFEDAEYNKNLIKNYFDGKSQYLPLLQLDAASIDGMHDVTKEQQPVIVTAASASHVSDTLIWVTELSKKKLKRKPIVFDIGLTVEQRRQVTLELISTTKLDVKI